MGFKKEKIKVYEQPYYSICTELFGRGDSYDLLKQKNKIEFISTSFLRGTTFSDCIVVCDELQNMTPGELNTIITRIGHNCKVIFSGDIRQTDLNKGKEMSGIADFIKINLDKITDETCLECFELIEQITINRLHIFSLW